MSLNPETVRAALAQIQDPYTETDLSTAIRGVGVDAGRVAIEIQLAYPAKGWHSSLESSIREKIGQMAGVENISVSSFCTRCAEIFVPKNRFLSQARKPFGAGAGAGAGAGSGAGFGAAATGGTGAGFGGATGAGASGSTPLMMGSCLL